MEVLTLEQLVVKLRKELRENYQSIGDSMIAGGATNYENYKYLLGQAQAYQQIDQALTDILNPKKEEEKDDGQNNNIVKFGRNSED